MLHYVLSPLSTLCFKHDRTSEFVMTTSFATSFIPTLKSPLLLSRVDLRGPSAALGFRLPRVRRDPSLYQMPLHAASIWRLF